VSALVAFAAAQLAVSFGRVFWASLRLDWNILLPGLAWRLFIMLYAMPAAIALARRPTKEQLAVRRT
jgi:hypothetical protein